MAAGTTYKKCGCREGGKRLGQQCPKLRRGNGTWSPVHGRWYYQLELPPHADGHRRPPLRHGGFDTQTDAEAELRQARELLAPRLHAAAGQRQLDDEPARRQFAVAFGPLPLPRERAHLARDLVDEVIESLQVAGRLLQ